MKEGIGIHLKSSSSVDKSAVPDRWLTNHLGSDGLGLDGWIIRIQSGLILKCFNRRLETGWDAANSFHPAARFIGKLTGKIADN